MEHLADVRPVGGVDRAAFDASGLDEGDRRPPGVDLDAYLRTFPLEMAFSAEDPGLIVDAYLTDDFEQRSDGLRIDRAALIAHARPARRKVERLDVAVHDVVADGERVAARYTLTATLRSGEVVSNEIYMHGSLAPDGRLRRIDQVTRPVEW